MEGGTKRRFGVSTESGLVRLELRWKAKRNSLAPAFNAAGNTLSKLDEAGYILGAGSTGATAAAYVHADAASMGVSLHAWFIGPGAWDAALAESEKDEGGFSIDDFCLVSRIPKVIDHTRTSHKPYPSFKKSLKSKPVLRLCATPGTHCPPLLAKDGGVVAQWKLPLSTPTRDRLHVWNAHARLITALASDFAWDEDECQLYTKWAEGELKRATSALAKEAKELAAIVGRESGLRVEAARPFHDQFAP